MKQPGQNWASTIHIFMPFSNVNDLTGRRIDDIVCICFKTNSKTFVTQLTNAKQIKFQIFNKKHIFDLSIRIVTNIANSSDNTFGVVTKRNIPTFFSIELLEQTFITGHVS